MNIKEWIVPLMLAVGMTYIVQYYFDSKSDQNICEQSIKSGTGFFAPSVQDVNKPLLLDIHYQQSPQDIEESLQVIKTSIATYVFSNKGAILHDFSFAWQNEQEQIKTLLAYQNCFLLAFEKSTPLIYQVDKIEYNQENKNQSISYIALYNDIMITKKFTIYDQSYQIDLQIGVQSMNNHTLEPLQLRLFIAQPVMQPEIATDKVVSFVNNVQGDSLAYIDLGKKDNLQKFWVMPTCFGYDTKFIVHAMIQNQDNFIQRAYMRKNNTGLVEGILESRIIHDSGLWNISFFVGPKTNNAMSSVDKRLLKTLNFGWLSPIAYPILLFLNYLQDKIGNYGWAIIVLTLLMKLFLLPFTLYTEKNMRKGVEMQKKMDYLQKKYKNDPEKLEQERVELIKKHGIPGIAGCLPLLLTLPIFIALNSVLSNAIELYGSSFLWINNLYAIDPYYILPILTGLAMLATPDDKDPKKNIMRYAMALLMATLTSYWSAGLVLFILMNTATSSLQANLQRR